MSVAILYLSNGTWWFRKEKKIKEGNNETARDKESKEENVEKTLGVNVEIGRLKVSGKGKINL